MSEKNTSENNVEGFAGVQNYLDSKYNDLADNYKEDGIHSESCSLIAIDIAKLFIKNGHTPQIFSVRGKVVDSAGNKETLYPKRYNGEVSWGGHTVCVLDGVVYDPMVGRPVAFDVYTKTVFSREVDMHVCIDSDRIADFIA